MRENKLNIFTNWCVLVIATIAPFFFFPYIINPLFNSKLLLLSILAALVFFSFFIKSLLEKKWQIIKTPFALPLLVFVAIAIISSFVNNQYPSKDLLGLGGVYLAFLTTVIFLPTMSTRDSHKWFVYAVNLSGITLSLLTITQFIELSTLSYINNNLMIIQLLSIILVSNAVDYQLLKKNLVSKLTVVCAIIGIGINVWAILHNPDFKTQFGVLPFKDSIYIAKNSLLLTKNLVFGYGADSYSNAYNVLRPIWSNGNSYWNRTFSSAANFPLTIIVNSGLIAFLAYLAFVWKVTTAKSDQVFIKTFVVASFLWQFLYPLDLGQLTLLAIALAYLIDTSSATDHLSIFNTPTNFNKRLFFAVNSIAMLAVASLIYYEARHFVAYHLLYKSSNSIQQSQLTQAYKYHTDARGYAPQLDFIRSNYAIINMQIANALSNKTEVSAVEQEQMLQLINQAIKEAKMATSLNIRNYQNWLVLTQIYIQLIDISDQAKTEAFKFLSEAISYNPNNPELRLVAGQLFFDDKKYQEAITFYGQAIERKPDLPISHYLLAKAFLANNQLLEAKNSLIATMNLFTDTNSDDYKKVEKELNEVISKLKEMESQAKQNQTQTSKVDSETDQVEDSSASSHLSKLLTEEDVTSIIKSNDASDSSQTSL